MAQRVAELPEIRMLSPELPNHPARHREIVGVTFVRPETSLIVYPRLLLPLKLRGAEAITTLLPKRGDRPRVTESALSPCCCAHCRFARTSQYGIAAAYLGQTRCQKSLI
jgi:hypothetical protein